MTIISKRKTHITMAVLFVFLTFLDQLTKKIASMYLIGNDITIIPNILELHYLENKGAAWGLFQNSTWILGCFSLLILGVIFYAYFKLSYEMRFLFFRIIL